MKVSVRNILSTIKSYDKRKKYDFETFKREDWTFIDVIIDENKMKKIKLIRLIHGEDYFTMLKIMESCGIKGRINV